MRRGIVCAECGKAVPYGRLSCSACGALLASVAGGEHPGPSPAADPAMASTALDASLAFAGSPAPQPLAPAGSWIASALAAVAPGLVGSVAPPAADEGRPADRSMLDVGLERAVAVGAGLIAAGLLLPWSRSVIGATGFGGYLDGWGLAGPAHALLLVVALALVASALIETPVAAWIRTGLVGFGLGAFTLGITWPYAVGPLGAGIGVALALVGAVVLVVAGVVTTWAGRHDRHASDV